MKPSIMQTLQIPTIGGDAPALLIQAGEKPMLVLVRNVGGVLVFLAHEASDLTTIGSAAGVYQLPPTARDPVVLAPRQALIAAASGGGGMVSIAASELMPESLALAVGD